MANKYFNEDMTADEARKILYQAAEKESKEEMAKIVEEYLAILPQITKKELSMVDKGWMT